LLLQRHVSVELQVGKDSALLMHQTKGAFLVTHFSAIGRAQGWQHTNAQLSLLLVPVYAQENLSSSRVQSDDSAMLAAVHSSRDCTV
jgi:hypothetical protein